MKNVIRTVSYSLDVLSPAKNYKLLSCYEYVFTKTKSRKFLQ